MKPSEWEVVILKPTRVFLSFLAVQLEEDKLPDMKTLQTDQTAYVIKKQDTEEEMLNEIEHHYHTMFQYEISRWLGKSAADEAEFSFFDFLCCFKFELYSQILLMESDFEHGKQLIRIKPRSLVLKWIQGAVADSDELTHVLEKVDIQSLEENATVVIKNFEDLTEIKPFLKDCYMPVYQAEMSRMCKDEVQWPEVNSYEDFNRYFAVGIHTRLVHLHH